MKFTIAGFHHQQPCPGAEKVDDSIIWTPDRRFGSSWTVEVTSLEQLVEIVEGAEVIEIKKYAGEEYPEIDLSPAAYDY
jgi:hypothetical protein